MPPLDRRVAIAGTAACALAAVAARAEMPPLRIIVPFPPGGPTDIIARYVADQLKTRLARTVIVDNKPGASGTIGTRAALMATDGNTLVIGNNQTHATAPSLITDAGYDPVSDFTPIAGLAAFAHVLVVSRASGIGTVSSLVARGKLAPGRMNYGSTGIGSGSHLAMELLMQRSGLGMQHVPYQGAAQVMGDLAAGRLDVALSILPPALPALAAREIVALAVASPSRAPQLPGVATLAEEGISGAEALSWIGLFAPKRGIADGVALTDAVAAITLDSAYGERVTNLGAEPMRFDRKDFRTFVADEVKRWGDVVRSQRIRLE